MNNIVTTLIIKAAISKLSRYCRPQVDDTIDTLKPILGDILDDDDLYNLGVFVSGLFYETTHLPEKSGGLTTNDASVTVATQASAWDGDPKQLPAWFAEDVPAIVFSEYQDLYRLLYEASLERGLGDEETRTKYAQFYSTKAASAGLYSVADHLGIVSDVLKVILSGSDDTSRKVREALNELFGVTLHQGISL